MYAQAENGITIRFALPSAKLAPYLTTYYQTIVRPVPSEPYLEDYFHPEWPNLRFMDPGFSLAAVGPDAPLAPSPTFAVTGPTSLPIRFRVVKGGRNWGVGLMPLGWAKFVGVTAGDYADSIVDGALDDAFAHLRPLAQRLSAPGDSFAAEVAEMDAFFLALLDREVRHADAIMAINEGLIDPDISTANQLAENVGMNLRSLERLSRQAFGFPPKLLLRRQRFLRSLAKFMLDPSMKWLNALDYQYHDQAHFVRDFKRFMGMPPSTYARLEKPMLIAAARARMEVAGEAVQGLHQPREEHSQS